MEATDIWHYLPPSAVNFVVRKKSVREVLLKIAEKKIYEKFVVENDAKWPTGVQEGRYRLLMNLFKSVNKAISDGRISSGVSKSLINSFIGKTLIGQAERVAGYIKKYGEYPPAFLTISPTKKCNLYCKGCYASSSAADAEKLSYEIFNKILKDKRESWGSYFTVISGGEPLLYRDGRKSFYDILENNRDEYFMMYTNGTLITKEVARRLAQFGNVTPAISVEGFEKETDYRRGNGVFKKILNAMENLRDAGVPFGVSATATRDNIDIIGNDKYVDFYFNVMGALYGWIFQYMPIGRGYTTDLMISPEQRLDLFKREERMIRESDVFLVDFWNGGPYTVGCIAAGRPGGYFYIDWNGNVSPCAFYPYYLMNINDLYKENKTLNDVLFSSYFKSIRDWQTNYGFNQAPDKVNNYIVPCPMRDHFKQALTIVNKFKAKPLDGNAAQALTDLTYHRNMIECGEKTKVLTQPYWEEIFKKPLATTNAKD